MYMYIYISISARTTNYKGIALPIIQVSALDPQPKPKTPSIIPLTTGVFAGLQPPQTNGTFQNHPCRTLKVAVHSLIMLARSLRASLLREAVLLTWGMGWGRTIGKNNLSNTLDDSLHSAEAKTDRASSTPRMG